MEPNVRMELTRQLEELKFTSAGASSRWLFIAGIIAEVIGGVAFLGGSVRVIVQAVSEDRLFWVGYTILLAGTLLLAHAAYLVIIRSMNRRFRMLYQAILDATAAP
jgi:hypothetical protein